MESSPGILMNALLLTPSLITFRGMSHRASTGVVWIGVLVSVFTCASAAAFDANTGSVAEPLAQRYEHRSPLVDVLLVTTSLLESVPSLEDAINDYVAVLLETEGLVAEYLEVDSDECLSRYGVRVTNPGQWTEIRDVLAQVSSLSGARYFVIMGGERVVPRPLADVPSGMQDLEISEEPTQLVPSDAWYVDFNGDGVVDDGFAAARLPDLGYGCEAVVTDLQNAVALHIDGGFTLDRKVEFTMYNYPTPPYGVCGACTMRSEFFALVSNNDYVVFSGHGDPFGFYSNSFQPIFTILYMDSIQLSTFNPVVIGYYSCNTGELRLDSPTLSYEFLRAGASAFVGRTTTNGVPVHVANNFPQAMMWGERIGDALFRTMRETVEIWGESFKAAAGHLVLYGDPTLLRRVPPPESFAGTYTTNTDELLLRWGRSDAVDLSHYVVHRGMGADFEPSQANLIATTTDTVVRLTGVPPIESWYFKLAAINIHGNASKYVFLAPENITVPTFVKDCSANWRGSFVEIAWTLTTDAASLTFDIARKEASETEFRRISPSVSRNESVFSFCDWTASPGCEYVYSVSIFDSGNFAASFVTSVSIPELELTLCQNYPNPFNPATNISFTLPKRTDTRLGVYNVEGKLVTTLVDGSLDDGFKEVTWDGKDANGNPVGSGVYFYRLTAGDKTLTKKMVLLK